LIHHGKGGKLNGIVSTQRMFFGQALCVLKQRLGDLDEEVAVG